MAYKKKPTGKVQSPTHKDTILAEIAKLDRRGWTQWDIADELKRIGIIEVSQVMVSKYLKEIRERCAAMMIEERKALIAEKVEQYREVRREAWDAWERSKDRTTKITEEKGKRFKKEEKEEPKLKLHRGVNGKPPNRNSDKGDLEASLILLKQIIVTEGRLPESEYLKIVKETIDAEVKLMGLTIEVNINNTQNNTQINGFPWDRFFAKMEGRETEAIVVDAKQIPEGEEK